MSRRASIYIEALRKPNQYKTEKGAQLKTDILHVPLPKGPAGQFGVHPFQCMMVMAYSKNQKQAITTFIENALISSMQLSLTSSAADCDSPRNAPNVLSAHGLHQLMEFVLR